MDAEQLRSIQAPFKARYRDTPDQAIITLRAQGRLGEGVSCKVETGKALVSAGLHPAAGGDGRSACSGDMLLKALVERYCVVYQTLARSPAIEFSRSRSAV